MRRGRKFKQYFSKKISWVVILTIILTSILIPSIISKAINSENQAEKKIIQILEVEPGNNFRFNYDTVFYPEGKDYGVKITKVNMPNFISQVNELNGQYDIVCIGNDDSGLSSKWNTGNAYRKYSALGSQKWSELEIDNETKNRNVGQDNTWLRGATSLWFGTLGQYTNWNDVESTKNGFQAKNNEKEFNISEYYSENDITNRRADDVLRFAKTGQLFFIEEDAMKIRGTKLKDKFNEVGLINSKTVRPVNKLNLDMILKEYDNLEASKKRPEVTMVQYPQGDVNTSDKSKTDFNDDVKGDPSKRNMVFKFKINSSKDSNGNEIKYGARILLDYNADGMFDDTYSKDGDSILYSGEVGLINEELKCDNNGIYTLEYKIEDKFIGFLDWKLEIYTINENSDIVSQDKMKLSNSVETDILGSIIFKSITDTATEYRILQIKSNEGNNLDLAEGKNRKGSFRYLLNQCKDYKFDVDSITVNQFNGMTQNKVNSYDMIIIGFADGYGNINEFTPNGVDLLQNFCNLNKSLMLTHDTMSLGLFEETFKGTYKTNNWRLTQAFKDKIGQSRYMDLFSNSDVKNHDQYIGDNKQQVGATAYSNVKLYTGTITNETKRINSAQISMYPYNLENKDIENYLKIAETHIQWYQLNLENEELVPWYNISGNVDTRYSSMKYNNGDSRNFYYTYSVGNITYSGTGHSDKYTSFELKLFVNTVYKAIRGANIPPVVSNVSADKTKALDGDTITVNSDEDFKFAIKVSDIDSNTGDLINVSSSTDRNCSIKLLYGENNFVDGNIDIQYKKGENNYVEAMISKEDLMKYVDDTIEVTSQAIDNHQGKSTEKKFKIKVIEGKPPTIIHGINKVKDTATSYPNFNFKSWKPDEVGHNIDETSKNREYMTVVPYAAYINTTNVDLKLKLQMSKNFEFDNKEPYYPYDDNKSPSVYVIDKDGNTIKIKNMVLASNGDSNVYEANISKEEVQQYSDKGYVSLLVEYYGKTYNHNMNEDTDCIMKYDNVIAVKKSNAVTRNYYSINVGYEPLDEDLI